MSCAEPGGQALIRPLWRHYYQNTDALIYVVDAADKERLEEAKEQLHATLQADELKDAALLVFANKMDLPGAMSVRGLADELGLTQLRNRDWHVQGAIATKTEGLYEGLDWVVQSLDKKDRK